VTGHTMRAYGADRGQHVKAGTIERLDAGPNRNLLQRALEKSLLYSEELGIDLAAGSDDAYFRWFLASLLFGARISETTAKNTYGSFVAHGLVRPKSIIAAGWDFLIYPVMREGGYGRYDGRKSTQILHDCDALIAEYGGKLRRLHDAPRNAPDLEQRLLEFYGVGPVTMNIFLRELRPFWAKADPDPLPIVVTLAKRLSIDLARYKRKSLTFARVEAGLIRRRRALAAPLAPTDARDPRRHVGARAFKVGDHVSWNSEAGPVSGLIVRVHTRDVNYKGYVHHANRDDPQYEIRSDRIDHIALHKGRALRALRH
jgi:hypothetical protein